MKLIEAVSQLRPKSLFRLLAHPDQDFRASMRWYYGIGRQVWPYELWQWFFHDHRTAHGPTVEGFLGMPTGNTPRNAPPSRLGSPERVARMFGRAIVSSAAAGQQV